MTISKQLKIDALEYALEEMKKGDYWICCAVVNFIGRQLKVKINTSAIKRILPKMMLLKAEWKAKGLLDESDEVGWWARDDKESRIKFLEELLVIMKQ